MVRELAALSTVSCHSQYRFELSYRFSLRPLAGPGGGGRPPAQPGSPEGPDHQGAVRPALGRGQHGGDDRSQDTPVEQELHRGHGKQDAA